MKIDIEKIIEIEKEKLGFPKDFKIKVYEMYPKDFIIGLCEPKNRKWNTYWSCNKNC